MSLARLLWEDFWSLGGEIEPSDESALVSLLRIGVGLLKVVLWWLAVTPIGWLLVWHAAVKHLVT